MIDWLWAVIALVAFGVFYGAYIYFTGKGRGDTEEQP